MLLALVVHVCRGTRHNAPLNPEVIPRAVRFRDMDAATRSLVGSSSIPLLSEPLVEALCTMPAAPKKVTRTTWGIVEVVAGGAAGEKRTRLVGVGVMDLVMVK